MGLNARKTLYGATLAFSPATNRAYEEMKRQQWLTGEQIRMLQLARLEQLVGYAAQHVPYYGRLFSEYELVQAGRVRMERFSSLPILEKSEIRANFDALTSVKASELHVLTNQTGGSTGDPLRFLQDRDGVRISGSAVLRLFYSWHGIQPGDREIKLWGSERDLFYRGKVTLATLRQWLSGITILNAFRMTPERMRDYIEIINRQRPAVIRGYNSNLYELAQFAEAQQLPITSPQVVFSSAGTLYPPFRQKMEAVFGSRVYNHYGSREMHNMAMECHEADGLHMSALTHYFEILDDENQPCPPGVEGHLVVTSLVNRAMPFIRYRIGDRAAFAPEGTCACGRGLPRLIHLSGRVSETFLTVTGQVVPGEYFIHLFGVVLKSPQIFKYQVIQQDYDHLVIRLVLRTGNAPEEALRTEMEDKIRLVMGQTCKIEFEVVDDIAATASGKYVYTISHIGRQSQAAPHAGQPS